MPGFLGALALLFMAASPALAQNLYVHGGPGFPSSSTFNDAYNTGFNVGLGVGIPITSRLEGVIMGRYDRFGLDAPSGQAGQAIEGGAYSSLSGTMNLKINGPELSSRVASYGFGGAGIFRWATNDIEENGTVTFEENSEVDFGLQFGAGLSFRMTSRSNLMVEPNYVVVFNEGENTHFFPLRLGVSFTL